MLEQIHLGSLRFTKLMVEHIHLILPLTNNTREEGHTFALFSEQTGTTGGSWKATNIYLTQRPSLEIGNKMGVCVCVCLKVPVFVVLMASPKEN